MGRRDGHTGVTHRHTDSPTHATTVGDGRPRPCGHGTVHQAPPSRMLASCGLLRHRQAAVPLPPLQRRRVVCCVLRAVRCAALGALLRLRACALQPRARAAPRSAALVERVVLLVLGQRGDDRLLGRPAVPGSAGRRGWTGEAGLWSTLVHSALLFSTLGGSLAEEVALRHLDDLLALVRDPHLVTTGLGLGLGSGSGWGQGQGHSLLAPGPHRDRPLIGLRGGDLGRREDLLDEARRGVALLVPAVSVTSNKGRGEGTARADRLCTEHWSRSTRATAMA